MNSKLVNTIFILISAIVVLLIIYIATTYQKNVDFIINEDKLVLNVNDVKRIDYTISDNIEISWQSSNPNIVSVDSNGYIVAKNVGAAIIDGSINLKTGVKSITCYVIVNSISNDIPLDDFSLPEGEILLSINEVYPIPITYTPYNGYIENINYIIDDDNVIRVDNGFITGLDAGSTLLTVIVNNTIRKEIMVNVIDDDVPNNLITQVKDVYFNLTEETIYTNEEKTLTYNIEPDNADIYDIKWEVNDENIISINEYGDVIGLTPGRTFVEVTVNNKVKQYIYINVKQKVNSITLDYNPKKILKVGETLTLKPTIYPSNIESNWVVYESSNPSCISISQNGTMIANSRGSSVITIRNQEGTIKKTIPFVVYDKIGVVNNDMNVWGFSKETDVIPRRADASFFTNLARKGKGTFNNSKYTISNYVYDVRNNLLSFGNNRIFMRIYYPTGKDLSTQNTFTFIGGVGEGGFGGYFNDIANNPRLIKSSGIIILIPEHNDAKVTAANVVQATNFVKLIINQNKNARNIIGGYSNGGPMAGEAAALPQADYDKIMLVNTSFYWVDTKTKLKNSEIVIYSPVDDSWHGTTTLIGDLYANGFKNVTIITNNSGIIERYRDKYLVINPGTKMKRGHTSENITLSHYFAFGCD